MKDVTVATLVHLKGTISPIPSALAFAREQSSREGGMNSLKVENIDGKYHEVVKVELEVVKVELAVEWLVVVKGMELAVEWLVVV